MSNIVCAANGCHNNWRQRAAFLDQECYEHRALRRSQCPCKPPYDLHPPPRDGDALRRWCQALRLKYSAQCRHVCSFHFVDMRPTLAHPYPEKWLGQKGESEGARLINNCQPNQEEEREKRLAHWGPRRLVTQRRHIKVKGQRLFDVENFQTRLRSAVEEAKEEQLSEQPDSNTESNEGVEEDEADDKDQDWHCHYAAEMVTIKQEEDDVSGHDGMGCGEELKTESQEAGHEDDDKDQDWHPRHAAKTVTIKQEEDEVSGLDNTGCDQKNEKAVAKLGEEMRWWTTKVEDQQSGEEGGGDAAWQNHRAPLPHHDPTRLATHGQAGSPHVTKTKLGSLNRRRALRTPLYRGCCCHRSKAQEQRRERRERALMNSVQKISKSQHELCSKMDTLLELLRMGGSSVGHMSGVGGV